MNIVIISGSHRPESNSAHVADFLAQRISQLDDTFSADVIKLGETPLPLWDESMWGAEGIAAEAFAPFAEKLKKADAAIIVAAEWNGTAPAALNNFFHYTGMDHLGHKPALLVGLTANGTNGVYPVTELRAFSTKNNKMCYMPDHLIVRHAGEIFRDNVKPEFQDADTYMRDRTDYTLRILFEYTKALKAVRQSGVTQTDKYGFGM